MGSILVTGVPGIGRTTLLRSVRAKVGLPIVTFGSVMYNVARSRGLLSHRDEMRRLPPEAQLEVQRVAALSVAKLGTCVVDTHLTVLTPHGMLAGMPMPILQSMQPMRILMVEAAPVEIRARRKRCKDRQHDDETEEQVEAHQALNRAMAMSLANLTGATVKIIFNHENKPENAVAQLLESMRGVPVTSIRRLLREDPYLAEEVPG